MTEKIEWYREVLELEPNSKVFLPLAKLLVEENGDSQAIDILQRGLDRHPDFLEARLFLIELLYKTGKNDERDAEVKKLGKMFATYAGFWQAWAACLSGDNEQDTASVLRFLAATFLHGPLSLHEVLNRGLASYIPQTRMAAPKIEAQTPAEEQAAEADNEAIAGETAGQPDIEHVNNHTLEEIVQPVAEENPVEIAAAEARSPKLQPCQWNIRQKKWLRNRKPGKRKALKARRLRKGSPRRKIKPRLQSRLWLWRQLKKHWPNRKNPRWKQRRRLKNWLRVKNLRPMKL